MNEIQEATLHFFGPITVAYILAGVLLLGTDRFFPFQKAGAELDGSSKPVQDLILGVLAAFAILAIGNFLRIDKVWKPAAEPWAGLWWILTNIEIFSPIFIVMFMRKQPLVTVYLSSHQIALKVLGGILASVICSTLFLILRSELGRLPEVLINSMQWSSLKNFPAVFMEGVAVAFLFVRLTWWLGGTWAILIPSLLFATSHIPGSWQNGDSIASISGFLVVNTILCMILLYSCSKTKDIIFLGIVHYVMDVTIKSF
jgi:hypothetical protein